MLIHDNLKGVGRIFVMLILCTLALTTVMLKEK